MIIHSNFQIVKDRERRYDVLLHKPFLERSEAEHFLSYYLLRNISVFCYYVLGAKLLTYQEIILRTMLKKPNIILVMSRGAGKTFLLSLYGIIKSIINPGSRVVICGSNRRQALFCFNEISKVYWHKDAGLFRQIASKPIAQPEESYINFHGAEQSSKISALPLASGDRIRGCRSNVLICDEFAVIPKDIYETVLSPMSAVGLNPFERVQQTLKEQELIDAGVIKEDDRVELAMNSSVLSSSASFQFTYFYQKYCEYKAIILKGMNTENKFLKRVADRYAIIQLSYEAIMKVAPGYFDEGNIIQAKNSMSYDRFMTEYGAQFVSDSSGFFKRSLLEQRTLRLEQEPAVEIEQAKDDSIYFISGDPASGENSKGDWFGILVGKYVVSEKKLYIVNGHGSTGLGWPAYIKMLRAFIRKFNPVLVTLDKFGGGAQVQSLLSSPEYASVIEGDRVLLPLDKDDFSNYSMSDGRILRMVVPESQWIEQANLHMQSMLDHEKLWFAAPPNDSTYKKYPKNFEDLENASDVIREVKEQISLIVGAQNEKGMTVFKMPDSLGAIQKKERVRKDLYTAAVLLCWGVKEYLQRNDNPQSTTKVYTPLFNTI